MNKINIDKPKPVQVNLEKLIDVGVNYQLVTKVNAIDTSELVTKLITTRKSKKSSRKYPAMINILLPLNLIN